MLLIRMEIKNEGTRDIVFLHPLLFSLVAFGMRVGTVVELIDSGIDA